MEQNCVLLDTSFFIRLLNEEDPLHNNALGYFRYFLEHDFVIKISTIAIASTTYNYLISKYSDESSC